MVAITAGYIDRDTLKQVLFLTETTEWDEYLDLLIQAVEGAIDHNTGRSFGSTGNEETRYLDGKGGHSLEIDDLSGLTSLSVDVDGDGVFEVALAEGSDFDLYPLNELPKTMVRLRAGGSLSVFPHAGKVVEITGVWGWPSVPGAVAQAALLTASRWFKRRDVEYGDATSAGSPRVLDPDVVELLRPFRRSRNRVLGVVK